MSAEASALPAVDAGEANLEFASFGTRLAALLIDSFILAIPEIALVILAASSVIGSATFNVLWVLWLFLGSFGYFTLLEGGPSGQTIGKRALGIRVADLSSGGSIGYGRALARNLVRVISGAALAIGYLRMLRDPKHQTWHDKAVSSSVVAGGSGSALVIRTVTNIRSGNLGVVPIVVGQLFIVVFFGFTATNFFTAVNFGNIIIQMAGTTMLAYGVVYVLLLGEIDLSIGYVAGIGALTVAELQLPGSGHQLNGLLAIPIAIAVCALIGGLQGSIVAFVGVPSFVVTLAGYLVWQGVILGRLEVPGSIIIQDRWINYTANYYFSQNKGWLIAAILTALYLLTVLPKLLTAQGRQNAAKIRLKMTAKAAGVAVACFGTVAICNHGVVQERHLGLPLAGVLMVIVLVVLTFLAKRTTFGRHVYAVGGNAEAARRAGINVARIRILVFMISSATAAIGGIILAAYVNSVALTFPPGTLLLNSIAAAVIGGVSLFGGRGEVRGALLGSLVIATVANGLDTAGYSNGTIYIVTGLILLFAVTLDTIARRLQVRSGR